MAIFTGDIQVSYNEVYASTGTSYDPVDMLAQIEQAIATIELVSGVFAKAYEREIPLSVTDAAWIKRAVIYQTAWNINNPDSVSRQAVSSISQDGLSLSAPNELTFVLAPLAKRALGNCSWAKSGTLTVAPAVVENTNTSFLTNDDHAWTQLGAV